MQVSGAHAVLYGDMSPAWMQSNAIPLLTHLHVQDTLLRNLPKSWRYANQLFYVTDKPCRPINPSINHLIIEPSQTYRDLRWLAHWPHAHWYFVRRPSAYRLGQLHGMHNLGITYLAEVPAIYIKKKAAFGSQPELD